MRTRPTGSRTASPTARKVNLTAKLNLNFWREDHDTPNLPPAVRHRRAGPPNDASVLLYDKYDIWEIKPDGTGAAHGHRRRWAQEADRLTATARSTPKQRAIPTDKPLLLSANDDKTESSGFYRVVLHRHRAHPRRS